MTQETVNISNITMELNIDVTPDKLWQVLTGQIGEWWPNEFYAGGEAGKRNFLLETSPGGRMYEEWENGGGVLWGTVICSDPGSRLQILGSLFPNWGGPSQWYGTWDLKANGTGSTLTFSETAVGKVSESGTAEKDKGWQFLWNTMKAYAENRTPPAWQD